MSPNRLQASCHHASRTTASKLDAPTISSPRALSADQVTLAEPLRAGGGTGADDCRDPRRQSGYSVPDFGREGRRTVTRQRWSESNVIAVAETR